MNPNSRPADPNDPAPDAKMLDKPLHARLDFLTEGGPIILSYHQSRSPIVLSTWYAEALLDGHRWSTSGQPTRKLALRALCRIVEKLRPERAAAWKAAEPERLAAEAAVRRKYAATWRAKKRREAEWHENYSHAERLRGKPSRSPLALPPELRRG